MEEKFRFLNFIFKNMCLVELNYYICFIGVNIKLIMLVNIISCIVEIWLKVYCEIEE